MKAPIRSVNFQKEYESKYGKLYSFKISFIDADLNEVSGYYSSKKKEQTYFKEGEDAEFNLVEMKGNQGSWYKIEPIRQMKNSNYARKLQQEQSKYSGFAMAYAKDLVVANKLPFTEMLPAAKKMFDFMVKLDKSIQNDNL